MKALFFILVTLFLIVVQTVIFPSFSLFSHCFDLMIIEVLFLSLISTHYSTLFTIILIGTVMDSISGVPFFYYMFSYLLIYFIVHLVKQLLFKQSSIFIVIISVVSVILQQGLLLFLIFVQHGSKSIATFDFTVLLWQAIWGLLFIPAGVWFLKILWSNWNLMASYLHKQIVKKIEE